MSSQSVLQVFTRYTQSFREKTIYGAFLINRLVVKNISATSNSSTDVHSSGKSYFLDAT